MDTGFLDECYRFRRSALAERYGDVEPSNFGKVSITGPAGEVYVVPDFHYPLGGGRLGMLLVPVSDHGPVQRPDGRWVAGSALVDDLLRARMGLDAGDPLYALSGYIRPDEHSLTWQELLSSKKLFYGHKHIGAYLGEGKSTHAPEDFHPHSWSTRGQNVWNVRGYPATLFFVALQGVNQATLNRNARIVDAILNKEILTPKDFERMRCRVSTLNTALQFYRDWIRQAEYLTDLSWFMSCGDHKALVVNIMLNVPHHRDSFLELFGNDGESLWSDFKCRFAAVFGREFQIQDETHFEPLWKKERLTAEEIRPLSLAQQNAFDAAQVEKRLDSFEGPRPLPPGIGMAWTMETPLALLTGFSSTYLPAENIGGVAAAAAVLGLTSNASERLSIVESQYRALVAPLVSKLLIADARQSGQPQAEWLTDAKARFRRILAEALVPSHGEACAHGQAASVADECFANVEQQLGEPPDAQRGEIVAVARRPAESGRLAANVFATPGVFHRIAIGEYPCSKFVSVRAVCTVVDQAEIEFIGKFDLAAPHGRRESQFELTSVDAPTRPELANDEVTNRASFVAAKPERPARIEAAVPVSSIKPAARTSCGTRQLVYALGQVGSDFGSENGRDAFKQRMRQVSDIHTCPQDERQLFHFLSTHGPAGLWPADSLIWTLGSSATPVYAIRAEGPFARECFEQLLHSFGKQLSGKAKWIAVPGTISGQVTLLNGSTIPVIDPDPRGMCIGTIEGLLRPSRSAPSKAANADALRSTVKCLLDRAYQEVNNPGLAPRDRALNFAVMSLLECDLIRKCLNSRKALDTIRVQRSTACQPDSDGWDILLSWFDPDDPLQSLRQIIRYRVDVSEVIPVAVGEVQSWVARA